MDKDAKSKPRESVPAESKDKNDSSASQQQTRSGKTSSQTPEVTWTASEYIAHNKGAGWYILLILAAVVLAVLVYLLSRDYISTVAVVIIAVIFAVAAGFKPRVLTYRLDAAGLTIGEKFYPYSNFKSFTISQEGAIPSITLMPLKRFMPSISVYFAPDDQEKIVGALSEHLPLNQVKDEFVDRMMHRIRF